MIERPVARRAACLCLWACAASAQTPPRNLLSDGSVPLSGPLPFGTPASPLLLGTAPGLAGLAMNLVSPGTAGAPGPATAHHGIDAHCTKQGYYQSASPAVGEIDCLNIVARQDGLNPNTTTNKGDAGDLGGILADVGSTLRAQNFTAFMEEHTAVVDTASNTTPYYMDMQEGVISTIGQPGDDGTRAGRSSMQAWFAALIDGHGSGLKLVEQPDPAGTAGKLGHGVIDNAIEVARYTGQDTYRVDGNGDTYALSWQLGTDNYNTNLSLGSPSNPFGSFATTTPYIDFNGMGAVSNVRMISDGPGQLSILNAGAPNYVFSRAGAVFRQPTVFTADVSAPNLVLSGGVVFPLANGNQTVLTTDANGALHIGGVGSGSTLAVDEPAAFSNVSATGAVSAASVTAAGAIAYGAGAARGAHRVVDESLSGTGSVGPIALTPLGAPEGAASNAGVVAGGGAELTAEVICEDGRDAASWSMRALYLSDGTSLRMVGASASRSIPPTAGAAAWMAMPTVDVANSAASIVVDLPIRTPSAVSCTARTEMIAAR